MRKPKKENAFALSAILDTVPLVLIGLDAERKIAIWNHQAEKMSGISVKNAIGRSLPDVDTGLDLVIEMVMSAQKDRQPRTQKEVVHPFLGNGYRADIGVKPLKDDAGIDCMICIEDVTATLRTQDLAIELEKMKTLAGLSAGLAHEINNPVGSIFQSTQNILRRTSPDFEANRTAAKKLGLDMALLDAYLTERRIFKFLDDIQKSVVRTDGIISSILNFSREKKAAKTSVDLAEVVESAIGIAHLDERLKRKYGFKRIQINKEVAKGVLKVNCCAGEIEQVVFILLKNAVQALAEKKDQHFKPKIDIRIFQQGDTHKLTVADNGPGISTAFLKWIFEPFYSTRTVDTGAGLGLFVANHIVTHRHQGTLTVESEPATGTVFTLTLPCKTEGSKTRIKENGTDGTDQ